MQGGSPANSAASSRLERSRWKLWRAWRVVATALGFVLLGLQLSVLGLVVIPLIRLLPGDGRAQQFRAQYCIHANVRVYLFAIQAMGICTIGCEGREKLREPGILVVANHPTLLDALALMAHMPQVDCVVKERYFHDRFLRRSAKGAGYIPSGDGPTMVDVCVERLRAGRSLIIFPEGTRSPVNELGPFARGAAHIALRAGKCPVPVTIQCEPSTLHRGQHWWEVPDRRFELTLAVGDPMVIRDFVDGEDNRGRAARELTTSLRSYFERKLVIV